MNTSTNEIPFKRLTPDSKILPFDCGNPDLTDYLFSSAKADMNQLLGYLEEWVVKVGTEVLPSFTRMARMSTSPFGRVIGPL